MSFPTHTSHKPSGYDWLGDIPFDWRIQKFRHLFRESSEKIESEVFGEMLSVSGYRGIERKEYDDENRRRKDEDLIGYRIVRRGQLVVNTMWLNYAGLGFSDLDGHVSPAYRAYWPRTDECARYLHYLLRSEFYVKGYTRLLTGVRPNSLQMSRDSMMSFPVILPDREEQLAIATFLDHETAKIDALIAEQQRLIELLQEKRQAVISHAATKGLNPNAPMKDSGVEWLGEVPEHWDVAPMRRLLLKIEQGWSPECLAKPADEDEWGVVKSGCVNRGIFNQQENKTLPADLMPPAELEIQAGDLLMSRASGSPELIGSAAFIEETRPRLLLSDKIFRLRANEKVDHRFLAAMLSSTPLRQQIRRAISGAVGLANNLPQSEIKAFVVPLPPLDEQAAIKAFITKESTTLNNLLQESESAITLLQERRSALISAAVTGQIDLRGLAQEVSA
jgi:type I restriction enzyme S subunit